MELLIFERKMQKLHQKTFELQHYFVPHCENELQAL